jgi:hypothetical protein
MSFIELFKRKQLPNLPKETELQETDIKKIHKNLPDDIFGETCSEWKGVICNEHKPKKGLYVNYYFNKHKTSLHRLLYQNYVNSKLGDKQYLINTCGNRKCLCIKHLVLKKDKDIPKKDELKIQFEINF